MNIVISQRIDEIKNYKGFRDSIDQRLITWVSDMGFFPILIPNSLVDLSSPIISYKKIENWINNFSIDGIILSGGNDIGEMPQRDLTENCLINWAEKKQIPLLGICRGAQMIFKHFGGEIESVTNHVNVKHELIFDSSQENFPKFTTFYYKNGLRKCPKNLKVIARSGQGQIEAIAHRKLKWEGWMWHPEREKDVSNICSQRFKNLVSLEKK